MSKETISTASKKEMFDHLFTDLKSRHESFIDFQFKHATIQIVILGWLFTAKSAHDFLQPHFGLRLLASLVIIAHAILHAIWTWHYHTKSKLTHDLLDKLNFMSKKYYKGRYISRSFSSTVIVSYSLISCFIVFFFLVCLRNCP